MHRSVLLSVALWIAFKSPCTGAIIFSETFGSPTGTISFGAFTGYTNGVGLSFSGSGDIRNTTPSNYGGASAGGNVFLTDNGSSSLQINGINTQGYDPTSFALTFGAYKSATASDLTNLVIAYSTNGTTFFNLSPTVPAQPTGAGTAVWRLISIMPTNLPVSSSLSLRFTNTSTTSQVRLDDISLSATAVPEPSSIAFIIASGFCTAIYKRRRQPQDHKTTHGRTANSCIDLSSVDRPAGAG
jgi:hypothetical protein